MINTIKTLSLFLLICCLGCTMYVPPKTTSGTIQADGLKIYYERQGKGDAILFLHAGLQNHTMWLEQVATFSKQYDVITIDMPFHGQSTGMDTTILVQDVIKIVLDSLHINKASIVGLSMGASAVQDFIIAYPERVNKAFLISASINGYDKKFSIDSVSMNWYFQFAKALEAKDTSTAAKEFTKAWAEGIYRISDSLQQPVSKYVYATTLANLKQHKMEAWPKLMNEPAAVDKLTTIKVPVLIIDGDKDLPYITTCSQYMEQHIPGAKRIVMKNVAHMLNMEKPDELSKIMTDFLAQ